MLILLLMWGKHLGNGPHQYTERRAAPANQGIDKKANVLTRECLYHQGVEIETCK